MSKSKIKKRVVEMRKRMSEDKKRHLAKVDRKVRAGEVKSSAVSAFRI